MADNINRNKFKTAMLKKSHDDKLYYWITLVLLFIFSLTTGIIGFKGYFILHGEEQSIIRSLYRTLQLYTFEGGDIQSPIPWLLHLARFTAPLTTIMAFLMALLGIFREQWTRLQIALMKNHVVIIGFGNKGRNIMQECLQNKEKVLVVEIDPNNPHISSIDPPKCRLLLGNATNRNTLVGARITKAKTVFLLMGDDTQQVNACLLIYQLIIVSQRNEKNPLNCIMHLQQPDFLNILRSHRLVTHATDGLALSIFNVYENSARELFEENPPDRTGITQSNMSFVQIVIFGFGLAGEALALQTAHTGHYINGKKPKVLIIDRLADSKVPDFEDRYPAFTKYCDLDFLAIDADSPQLISKLIIHLLDPLALTTIVLCFDNQTHNLLLGLQLDSITLPPSHVTPQVFARTNDNESFITFSWSIKPYGLPSKVCSQEIIIEGNLDVIAKAIHADYLAKRKSEPDFGTQEADVPWEELSQEYKDSNRKAADHMGIKMRGIGCEIVDNEDPRSPAEFTDDEIEILSKFEHQRWCAERELAGWIYGPVRNDTTRENPYIVDWNDPSLKEDIKDYDRDAVKNIPKVLEQIEKKVVRR